jgi:hypothetical protein
MTTTFIVPPAAEIAPATSSPDHPDHALAKLYDEWRLLFAHYEAGLEAERDEDETSAAANRADAALATLARMPAHTVDGLAIKLAAWRLDTNVTDGDLDAPGRDPSLADRLADSARLDALRLASDGRA